MDGEMRESAALAMLVHQGENTRMATAHKATMRYLSVLVIASLCCAGCTRTYIFGPDQMPKISDRTLEVRTFQRSHAPIDSFDIERIGLRHLSQPSVLRAPNDAEYAALLKGDSLAVHSIEIDVDASTVHWRDYGLGGVGIGMSAALVANLSGDGGLLQESNGMALLGTMSIGFVGFLTGLIVGSLAAPDVIDTRFTDSDPLD